MNNGKSQSIQALRGLLIIEVFLGHSGIINLQWGAVESFLVLSGFLLMANGLERQLVLKDNILSNLSYAWKKISKLYHLHIFMTLLALPILLARGGTGLGVAYRFILNIFLLQSWVPVSNVRNSMNMVSWYLCVYAFLAFTFPIIFNKLRKLDAKKISLFLAFAIALEIVTAYAINVIVQLCSVDENLVQGLTYNFPLFRTFDFFIGCCVGALFVKFNVKGKDFKSKRILFMFLELITFALVALNCYISLDIDGNWNKWYALTFIHILPSCMLVVLYALNKGLLAKVSDNKILVWIGNLSGFLFLIHELVLRYFNYIVTYLKLPFNKYLSVVICFCISILLSVVWEQLNTRFRKRVGN